MNIINNKESLTENEIEIIDKKADGNCFFSVLSWYFYSFEDYHIYMHKQLALYIEKKKFKDETIIHIFIKMIIVLWNIETI